MLNVERGGLTVKVTSSCKHKGGKGLDQKVSGGRVVRAEQRANANVLM